MKFGIAILAVALLAGSGCSTCVPRSYLGMTREQAAEAASRQKRKAAGPMKGSFLMTVSTGKRGQFVWQFPRTKEQALLLGGNASEWELGFHKESRFFGSIHFYRIHFEKGIVTEQMDRSLPWWWSPEE